MPTPRKTAKPPELGAEYGKAAAPELEEGDDGMEATIGTGPATTKAAVPAPVPQAPAKRAERAKVPSSDRVGMLAHLVEHWSQVDRPATFSTKWAGGGDEVEVTFVFSEQKKGKWVEVTKVAIGMNIDDAACNLAGLLAQHGKE